MSDRMEKRTRELINSIVEYADEVEAMSSDLSIQNTASLLIGTGKALDDISEKKKGKKWLKIVKIIAKAVVDIVIVILGGD